MVAQKASIKTEVPGPKSVELGKMREKYLSKGVGIVAPVYIERAEGSLLYDIDGNVFIDMGSGIGVNNVGKTGDVGNHTLRWVKDNKVVDLYVDGLSTDDYFAATGLRFHNEKKGPYVLSKRVSRIMRPYFVWTST